MLESAWLFIGGVAVFTSGFALSTQTKAAAYYQEYADPIAMVAGLLGTLSWGMLAYGSLDVEVVGDSVIHTFSMPSVTLWCLMLAIPPMYVALTGPLEVMKTARQAEIEDV